MYMGYNLLFYQTSDPIVQRKVVAENEYGREFIENLEFKNVRTRLLVELEKKAYQTTLKTGEILCLMMLT